MCWGLWFLCLIPNQIRFSVIPGMTAVSELGHTLNWPLVPCYFSGTMVHQGLFWVPRERSRDLWCLLPPIDWWCFIFRTLCLYMHEVLQGKWKAEYLFAELEMWGWGTVARPKLLRAREVGCKAQARASRLVTREETNTGKWWRKENPAWPLLRSWLSWGHDSFLQFSYWPPARPGWNGRSGRRTTRWFGRLLQPGWERRGGGWVEDSLASNSTPLQYSCLENPMDRGAWKAAVHGVTEGQTRLSDFTFTFQHLCIGEGNGNPLQWSCLENPRDGGAAAALEGGLTIIYQLLDSLCHLHLSFTLGVWGWEWLWGGLVL